MQGSSAEPLTAEVLAGARSQQISQGAIPVIPILDSAAGDIGILKHSTALRIKHSCSLPSTVGAACHA